MNRRITSTVAAALVVNLWPTLSWAAPAAHGDHGGIVWISDVFGNTGKTGLVFLLINFAVLFYILDKVLFSKLRARTADKHATVKSELTRATEAHAEAKAMVAEYREKLDGLTGKAEALLAEAAERAEADRKRIIAAAEREAEQIKASARAAAERDAEYHRRVLEAEVVDRAVERAEQIIRDTIGPADQRTMVEDYVAHLGGVDFSGESRRNAATTTPADGAPS